MWLSFDRRFYGNYNIGLINRIRYPLFAIYILDIYGITDEEKEKFKNGFLKNYMTSKEFRESVKGKVIHIKTDSIGNVYTLEEFNRYIDITNENYDYVIIKDSNIFEHNVLCRLDVFHNR